MLSEYNEVAADTVPVLVQALASPIRASKWAIDLAGNIVGQDVQDDLFAIFQFLTLSSIRHLHPSAMVSFAPRQQSEEPQEPKRITHFCR